MDLRGLFAFLVLCVSGANYAQASSRASPRTLWLDDDEDTAVEADGHKNPFHQDSIKDHVKEITKKFPDQKDDHQKSILEEWGQIVQHLKKPEDHDGNNPDKHIQQDLKKDKDLKDMDASQEILTAFQKITRQYLIRYCVIKYRTEHIELCLLLCSYDTKKQSDETRPSDPPITKFLNNTNSKISSNHGRHEQQDKIAPFPGYKHVGDKIDQTIDQHDSKTKSSSWRLPVQNRKSLKRAKRWTQALSNLIHNNQISGVPFRTTGVTSYYIDPYYIISGTASANGLSYEQLDRIAYVIESNAQARTAAIGARANSGYSGQVVVYF